MEYLIKVGSMTLYEVERVGGQYVGNETAYRPNKNNTHITKNFKRWEIGKHYEVRKITKQTYNRLIKKMNKCVENVRKTEAKSAETLRGAFNNIINLT